MNQAIKQLELEAPEENIPNIAKELDDLCRASSNLTDVKLTPTDFKKPILNVEEASTFDESDSTSYNETNDKYEIAYKGEELDPWSLPYIGIPINYFSVGLIYAGSVSILYPLLIIQAGVTSSFYTAAANLVTVFWSYKIFFGFLSDCFPIFRLNKKPYIIIGWILCAVMLIILAFMGVNVTSKSLVLMLTFANLGYVMADVAADGYMVWMAHREPVNKRGRMQTLIYTVREVGRIAINIVIIFGFSGPNINCPGYEANPNVACTNDESVMSRNNLSEEYPDEWCYMQCNSATFDFGLTIPQYMWIIAGVNIVSIPSYFLLHEDENSAREKVSVLIEKFWRTMKRRAVWQVMLYSMISHITFNVYNPAKVQANHVWLNLSTLQNQGLNIIESLIFFTGLSLIRKYALNFSWRKLVWIGSILVTIFNLLYILIVYDIMRNPWFYMFTDVSATFIYSLNFMASTFCIVEVAEPGFEAMTYALITTAGNAVLPLSSVISYQFMAILPDLNTQEGLATDTKSVRNQFALLVLITEIINVTSLLSLPLLPRQKKETRELVAKGETSGFWAGYTLISGFVFLVYSTLVTFLTVAGADVYGCYKVLGGAGCTEDESSAGVYLLIGVVFLYCYGTNFYLSFWPCIVGREKFSWDMFF